MARWRFLLLAALAIAVLGGAAYKLRKRLHLVPTVSSAALTRRWVFSRHNLATESGVEKLQDVMRRAKTAGYNGVVLADSKLTGPGARSDEYAQHAAEIAATARKLGLDLYAAVCPIGYSNSLLREDPNLAEGLPVRDALFVARNGVAELVPDPAVSLSGGDFEGASGDKATGWDLQDGPGSLTRIDTTVHHGGGRSLRMADISRYDARSGRARVMQRVSVTPFREYHLSVWIKTEYFTAPETVRARILTPDGRDLHLRKWEIGEKQDWTEYHAVFNSLDNRQLQVYLGAWEGEEGSIWWDDARLEEVGLLSVLRRDGCPLKVRGENGTTYTEGRDFAPVADAHLIKADAPDEYDPYHPPPTLRLLPGSRIKDGERLRVSYYHSVVTSGDQVSACLTDPKVDAMMETQIRRVEELLHPKGYLMQHDEIRVMNWCAACQARHLSAGQLLADNVGRCVRMIRKVSPNAQIAVWSDMFDPHHNAAPDYALVNGSLAGGLAGVPTDVTILNWNGDQRRPSMEWFAGKGYSQVLAGYYDRNPERFRGWLEDAGGIKGVSGAMYTTWDQRYGDLERFAGVAWGR